MSCSDLRPQTVEDESEGWPAARFIDGGHQLHVLEAFFAGRLRLPIFEDEFRQMVGGATRSEVKLSGSSVKPREPLGLGVISRVANLVPNSPR
jgi:hypothetical protein